MSWINVPIDTEDIYREISKDIVIDWVQQMGIDPEEIYDDIGGPDLSRRMPPQNVREKLCEMFDLAALTPVDEILKTIEEKIR